MSTSIPNPSQEHPISKQSEAQLLALFEQAPLGFAFLDADLVFLEVNPVLASQLGAPSPPDVAGLRLLGDFPELQFTSGFVDALRDQRRVEDEVVGDTPWGRSVRLRVIASPIEQNGTRSHVMISRDASERHRLESEVRRVAARNEAVLEASVDGIATMDAKGRLVSVNSALEHLFGYTREELVHQNVKVLMPEPYRSEHDEYLRRYRETGVPRIIGFGREVEGRRKDGQVFPLRLSVGEIHANGERLFVGVLSDLSERAKAEREVSTLGQILEEALNEIYVFDAETLRFRTVNRGARENLGYDLDELRSMTPVDIKPEFDLESFRGLVEPLQTGALQKAEFKTVHRRKDGSEYRVEVHLQYRVAAREFVAIILDITEREALERQLLQAQRMEAVGQLAGGIAHDFNNLLTSILGSSELLESRLDPEDRSMRAVQRIRQAAARGASLTQQLLAFGRKQVSQPEVLDVNEAVTGIGELTGRLIGEDVELVLELSPSLRRVNVDPAQLDQVLMNLIVNASDAMPTGGVLTVTTEQVELSAPRAEGLEMAPGLAVVLSVRDTGIGMPPDVLRHIFEPFFTTKDVGKGTGLGLSTVYGVVKQCGWGIEVSSAEGKGSTFRVWIPSVSGEACGEQVTSHPDTPAPPQRARILLVEDDAILREHVLEMLEDAGYEVVSAEDPEEALAKAQQTGGRIDLLLSDIVMPGITGLELARRLRGSRPALRVLLMSGYADTALAGRGALPAEFPVLAKPFSNEALVAAIREEVAG